MSRRSPGSRMCKSGMKASAGVFWNSAFCGCKMKRFPLNHFWGEKGAFWETDFSSGLLLSFWVVSFKARGDFGFQFPKSIGYELKIETLGHLKPEVFGVFLTYFIFFPCTLNPFFFFNEIQKLNLGGTAGRMSPSIPVFPSLIIS